jgi:hypothetical protein
MTTFREGQDVEVLRDAPEYSEGVTAWRKAKIVSASAQGRETWIVQFPDGTRAVYDAAHIRAAPFANSGLNEELQKHEAKREIESKSFAGRKGENPSWE